MIYTTLNQILEICRHFDRQDAADQIVAQEDMGGLLWWTADDADCCLVPCGIHVALEVAHMPPHGELPCT